ncbi:MAG: hypothetical protein KC475_08880, partial [Cyanobacteria bacterium HKST-UBA03]|nr:hypothetical protein [Cyanobacteria bacterium HKST-UBA03]
MNIPYTGYGQAMPYAAPQYTQPAYSNYAAPTAYSATPFGTGSFGQPAQPSLNSFNPSDLLARSAPGIQTS